MEEVKLAGVDALIDKLDLHERQVENMKQDNTRVNNQINKLQKKMKT